MEKNKVIKLKSKRLHIKAWKYENLYQNNIKWSSDDIYINGILLWWHFWPSLYPNEIFLISSHHPAASAATVTVTVTCTATTLPSFKPPPFESFVWSSSSSSHIFVLFSPLIWIWIEFLVNYSHKAFTSGLSLPICDRMRCYATRPSNAMELSVCLPSPETKNKKHNKNMLNYVHWNAILDSEKI